MSSADEDCVMLLKAPEQASQCSYSKHIRQTDHKPCDIEHKILLSFCAAARHIFTSNVEALTIHKTCSFRSLGVSYHPTDLGTEEVTKPRHPSAQFVTSSQQEAYRALPLCSVSQRPTPNLSRSRKRLSFLKRLQILAVRAQKTEALTAFCGMFYQNVA